MFLGVSALKAMSVLVHALLIRVTLLDVAQLRLQLQQFENPDKRTVSPHFATQISGRNTGCQRDKGKGRGTAACSSFPPPAAVHF